MAHIKLSGVGVDFPVFNSRSRGLINSLFQYAQREQGRIESAGLSRFLVHALRDINLDLVPGDRVGIVGGNGAGKTTLLRVLSGAYEPTAGVAEIEGAVSSLTDMTLGIDVELTGFENIVLRSIIMGKTRKKALALTPEIEAFSELGSYLNLPVRAYSHGMVLRLAFAISTAEVPEILVMDEMIGTGDAAFLAKAHARIEQMMCRVSILAIASHNEEIIRAFCNKVIIMDSGRIIESGPVEPCLELYLSGKAVS